MKRFLTMIAALIIGGLCVLSRSSSVAPGVARTASSALTDSAYVHDPVDKPAPERATAPLGTTRKAKLKNFSALTHSAHALARTSKGHAGDAASTTTPRLGSRNGHLSFTSPALEITLDAGMNVRSIDGSVAARLSLHSIRSGNKTIYDGSVPNAGYEGVADHATAQRGPVVERLIGVPGGIEQLFDLASPIAGVSSLDFAVSVETAMSAPENGTSGASLTFWSGQHVGLLYGHVLTVDAAGSKVASDCTYSNGEISFSVPAAWLATATYPLTVDPLIGTVIDVDADTAFYFVDNNLDVTYNATADEYFAVWNEGASSADANIFGAIINPTTGAVTQVTIDATTNNNASMAVCWNPSNNRYLVTYADVATLEMRGLVLDQAGAPVNGTATFNISATAAYFDVMPEIATDGSSWMVVWQGYDTVAMTGDILAREVNGSTDNTTQSFGTATLNIQIGVDDEWSPQVAFAAGTYLCAWLDFTNDIIEGKTISTTGTVGVTLNTYSGAAGPFREDPSMTANSTAGEFLIGWDEYVTAGDPVVRRASSTGAPLGSVVIVDSDATTDAIHCTVQYNVATDQYFVAWYDDNDGTFASYDIQCAQLSGAAAAVLQTNIAFATPASQPVYGYKAAAAASRTNVAGATHVLLLWRIQAAAAPHPVQAQRYDMNNPPAAPLVASMIQKQGPAATAPTDAEGVVYITLPRQESFSGGAGTDPEGQQIRLQIERILNSASFTGTFTEQSGLVASGGTPTITVSGIANGQYKWRARFVDALDTASAWVEFGVAGGPDHEFNVPNQIPPAPAIAQSGTTQGQFLMNGTTAIALGGVTPEGTVILKGTIGADADGDNVRLEVEVQPAGSAFTGVATVTSAFGPAGNHQVSFTPVTSGAGYRWQAWTRDSSGAPIDISAAVDFGANGTLSDFARDLAANTTNAPTALAQFEANGITPIAIGGTAAARTVVLQANVTDPNGDTVAVEVEVKPIGTAFDGAGLMTGNFVPAAGGNSRVTFSLPPALSTASYQWRVRTIDSLGAVSAFVEFVAGGAVDFILPAVDPGGSRNNLGCPLSATAMASPWLLGLVLAAALLALRRR